jgi:hypothetical protein
MSEVSTLFVWLAWLDDLQGDETGPLGVYRDPDRAKVACRDNHRALVKSDVADLFWEDESGLGVRFSAVAGGEMYTISREAVE